MSADLLTYRNDAQDNGVNAAETALSPVNVKLGSFGKIFATTLDGAVYAQPLTVSGQTIGAGVNTVAGAAGTHDVVFVATEHDSLYAIDSHTGAILWRRTLLDATNPGGDVNNTLGATSLSTLNSGDVNSGDLGEVGITSTPAIDEANGVMYVEAKTKEVIGGATVFVQRLHAISLADGTDTVAPYLIGSTTNGNTNTTQIYSYGTGAGAVTDPYNGTGQQVVQFNALRENQRSALSLVGGKVYVEWASHGDNGPYHGWIVAWDVSQLATSGMKLAAALDLSPNGSEAGVWESGAGISFDSSGAGYVETGNGPGGHGNPTLNAAGFPSDGDYYEAVVKIVADPTSTPTSQNANGWGLKVSDYFIPSNIVALDNADQDLGSGGPLPLPASAGIPGHPDLLAAAGKQGVVYILDRDNLGKFNATTDQVVSEQNVVGGVLSTPSYFNGRLYYSGGYSSNDRSFTINTDGTLSPASQTNPNVNFGYLPGSMTISANGTTGGIVWALDRNANELHAFDADALGTELWNSGQAPNQADSLGAAVKFGTPTVSNGQVFVGTVGYTLVSYGLQPPPNSVPVAPSNLAASTLSSTSVALTWFDNSIAPNAATGFIVQESTDGSTFNQITSVAGGTTSIALGGLASGTKYYFRVIAFDGPGSSAPSNVASATTGSAAPQAPVAPSGLGATPVTATSIALNWTNNALNQTGFAIDRATDPAFTQNLVTLNIPASPYTYTDTSQGLNPGNTYYYRIRATNAAGASANSHFTVVSIPVAPPKPTNALVTGVTTGEVDLSWTDNAGTAATSYLIERRVGTGSFTNYATLPALNTTPPDDYTWSDTNVLPGTAYEYHILALNSSGNNDFTGTNVETLTLAPSGLNATAGAGQVALAWTAPAGAVSYNIYRGTAAGQETLLAGGVTATSYADATALAGTTYFYTVAAVNANTTYTPPLPSLSAASNEVSATPTAVVTGAPVINFPNGFATGTAGVLTFNGGAAVSGANLLLTDGGGYEARSVFTTAPVAVGQFSTTFTFQLSAGAATADGFAFVIQGVGNTALGSYGGGLGYGTDGANAGGSIGRSLAIKFDLYNNQGEGADSTGLSINGASPTSVGSVDMTGSVDLHSGDAMRATLSYDGSNLVETVTDTVSHATFTHTYTGQNIPGLVGGGTAYVGFTAGTGGLAATQAIQSWTYSSTATPPANPGQFPNGFATGTAGVLTFNGGAAVSGANLLLTDGGGYEARSVFTTAPVAVGQFSTTFTFQLSAGAATADGFAFVIQGVGNTALGSYGGGLGYGTDGANAGGSIGRSLAIKFDLYNNQGEGADSTGLSINGASPTSVGSVDMTGSVDLHSGDAMRATLSYDGSNLVETVTDTVSHATFTHTYTGQNIPGLVGGGTAYVGFTAGTGGLAATQAIQSWTYSSTATPPATPNQVNLGAAYNETGIYADGVPFTGGIGGTSNAALSGTLLGTTATWNGNTYALGAAGSPDLIQAVGQTVALTQNGYSKLSFLAFANNGSVGPQTFTITYTDGSTQAFSQGISDWHAPQNYAGETEAIAMGYKDTGDGMKANLSPTNAPYYLYGYSVALNPSKTVRSITLPYQLNINIAAIDLT